MKKFVFTLFLFSCVLLSILNNAIAQQQLQSKIVNNSSRITISNNGSCVGATLTADIINLVADTIKWNLTNGNGVTSTVLIQLASTAGTAFGTMTTTAAGDYFAIASNSTKSITSNIITINNKPSVAAITGGSSVCVGNSIVLSNTIVGGVWSTSNSSIASLSQINNQPAKSSSVGGSSNAVSNIIVNGLIVGTVTISYTVSGTSCDSTVSIVINVIASTSSTTNKTICSNELPFNFNGINCTNAGTFFAHLTNAAGCDSTAILILTVNASSGSTTNKTICNNELPFSFNGISCTNAGTFVAHLTNAIGCDSAATLVLTINATSGSTTNTTKCSNELPFDFNGISCTSAGTFVAHLTNAIGCDSAATLILSVNATSSSTTNKTICSNELPFDFNGISCTSPGTFVAHLTNVVGCDSAATLVLSILIPISQSITLSGCNSGVVYKGITYTNSTILQDTIPSLHGCDSIFLTIHINITILSQFFAPSNLLPANNTVDLNIPIALSWSFVPNALSYDLYVWKSSDTMPTIPSVAGITQVFNNYVGLLELGTAYSWKIVAIHGNCSAESAIQNFTTRSLPDLIVDSVIVPANAVSESDITIKWRTKNIGAGNTKANWVESVYFSDFPGFIFGSSPTVVGSVANFSSLTAGSSYISKSLTFHIPIGYQGTYYVFVNTNGERNVTEREVSDTNNIGVSIPIHITLAPPPDLKVDSVIVAPSTVFSGKKVGIQFKVKNFGTGPTATSNWQDIVYLSPNPAFDEFSAAQIYTKDHTGTLLPNQSYTVSDSIDVPSNISGDFYLHVVADGLNNVFENLNEDNNTTTSNVYNVIASPTPNLIVNNVNIVSDSFSTHQSFGVQWTTSNNGAEDVNGFKIDTIIKPFIFQSYNAVATNHHKGLNRNPIKFTIQTTIRPLDPRGFIQWKENVYLSKDTFLDESTDVLIGQLSRSDIIKSLTSTSPIQTSFVLPDTLSEGTYYVFVKTDANDDFFENPSETDNASTATGPITILNPDLVPTQLTVPATGSSDQSITVNWKVKNNSKAGVYNSAWKDKIYLSTDNVLSTDDTLLSANTISQFLAPNGEYFKQATIKIPTGFSGNYFAILATDDNNNVHEKVETNNTLVMPISISLSPSPDLQVTSITVPATDTLQKNINISYTITNNGVGSVENVFWEDAVYLSPNNNFNDSNSIILDSIVQTNVLSSGQFYTHNTSYKLPAKLKAGNYHIIIVADRKNKVFENTNENNNIGISSTITLVNPPAIDLSVTSAKILSTTITAGKPVNVQWTVKNNSTIPTIIPTWKDAIYLSSDTILDVNDSLIGSFTINESLNANASYTQTQNVNIPNEASGIQFLLVVADKENVHSDPLRNNNVLPLKSATDTGTVHGVTIVVPPPSDLIPTNFSATAVALNAQPITINYTVKNIGVGITPVANWKDKIYLSIDNQLNGDDILLATVNRNGVLSVDSIYSNTVQATLPADISGNFILLLKTDADNAVYELNNNNNLSSTGIIIQAQLPSDLVVSKIISPSVTQIAGDSMTINWEVKNTGIHTALGYLKEAVYLSTDTVLDANDILFGTLESNINIIANSIESHQIKAPINNVEIGTYYVIVSTDILHSIKESDYTNNITISFDSISVDVKELLLNQTKADSIISGLPLNYRIEIPDSLVNQTLSVQLKGDSVNKVTNQLFVSHGNLPDANDFDFSSAISFSANQNAVIPSLEKGTYYLTATNQNAFALKEPVSLLATIIPFSITNIESNRGGNVGTVTVKLSGARFEAGMIVKLTLGSMEIVAQKLTLINSVTAFASFDLNGKPLGIYSVKAVNAAGKIALLSDAFEIVGGSPGGSGLSGNGFTCSIQNIGFDDNLHIKDQHPKTARANSTVVITIAFENTGNVDIPIQKRIFTSPEGIFINFSPDYSGKLTELILECKEEGGPPDVLRPGATGSIRVYAFVKGSAHQILNFLISE